MLLSSRLLSLSRHPLSIVAAALLTLGLSGCAVSDTPVAPPASRAAISGMVHGGSQPISSANIYLYAVANTQAGPAQSLLRNPVATLADGSFSISGDYPCPSGAYVYLLALDGNPGLPGTASNSRIGLATGLGACGNLSPASFITINEATTVATAYALAQFATSETNIGADPAFTIGIQNAFGNIGNLIDLQTGSPLTTTPAGNGIVPQALIDTLADALAGCVNSDGTDTGCSALMTDAGVTGASGTPIDTFQAVLNIARNPALDPTDLFNLAGTNGPYQPTLGSAPNDWTMTIQYSAAANPNTNPNNTCYYTGAAFTDICQAQGVAIDATGNVWVSNLNADASDSGGATSFEPGNLVKFSPAGAEISPPGGYTTASLYKPQQIGIDTSGYVWVASRANTQGGGNYPDSLQKFTPMGVAVSGTTGYTGGGLVTPRALAIDFYGNIWTAGTGEISEFSSAGTPLSAGGFTNSSIQQSFKIAFDGTGTLWDTSYILVSPGTQSLVSFAPVPNSFNQQGTYGGSFTHTIADGSATVPSGLAIDSSNNIWVSNAYTGNNNGNFYGPGFLSEYNDAGAVVAASDTNAGISYPNDVAINGAGNVFGIDSPLGEIANNGTALSPTGWQSPNPNDCCFTGAIDSSGNLWLTGAAGLYQMIGIAVPVVTPVVSTLSAPTTQMPAIRPAVARASSAIFPRTVEISGKPAASAPHKHLQALP